MAGQIAEKSLRHVSLCVSDLAEAKPSTATCWDLRSCRARTSASRAWLSVGGDLQLHLLENSELAAAGTDHRRSIADPHFALWINDVLSLVEDLRGKGLEVLENRPSGAPFQRRSSRIRTATCRIHRSRVGVS